MSMSQSSIGQHREGGVAKMIENQTAKLPSDLFLWGAAGCIGGSVLLQLSGAKHASLFVGQWVPTLLILGLYNKLVKVAGSDQSDRGATGNWQSMSGSDGQRSRSLQSDSSQWNDGGEAVLSGQSREIGGERP
jgi:hypothetical protein